MEKLTVQAPKGGRATNVWICQRKVVATHIIGSVGTDKNTIFLVSLKRSIFESAVELAASELQLWRHPTVVPRCYPRIAISTRLPQL